MQELIDRLEKATGPDRRLDFTIHDTLFPPKHRPIVTDVKLPPGFGDDAFSHAMDPRPNYTASIDAALTLVPEPWRLTDIYQAFDEDGGAWHASVRILGLEVGSDEQCATPAIALCIAALKARLTVVSGGRDG